MRIYAPTSPRVAPLDRLPTTINTSGTSTVAGGGTTIQATYTVPAGRRADLSCQVFGLVATAFAAGQSARVYVQVTKSGGAAFQPAEDDIMVAAALGVKANPGVFHVQLNAGDKVDIVVNVGAGAGAVTGGGGIQGTEYDA